MINYTQLYNAHGLEQSSTDVPQGSILGPFLFSLYVNDFPIVCPDVMTQMYADDISMTGSLSLHGKKTACMYFSDGMMFISLKYLLRVKSFK